MIAHFMLATVGQSLRGCVDARQCGVNWENQDERMRDPIEPQGFRRIVVTASSMGGVDALRQLLADLPATFPRR
jgi:chemotaxis response regulator CheB